MPSGKQTDTVITITPQNYGQKKVVLETMGFLFPKEKKAFQVPRPFGAVQFPHELEPEASCTMWGEARGIANSLREEGIAGQVKAIAYVCDAVGRQYRSNALAFDINRWDSDTKT